jgi:2-deoxy-D-gluconate 3-dehydrogenase
MATNPFDLSGKVAFITGGNGGLGLGMGIGLAEAGASIVVASRDEAKTRNAVAQIESTGAKAVGVSCDVVNADSIASAVRQAVEAFGGIDLLINNSGTSFRAQPEDIPEDEWDRVIDTNLKGPFLVSKAVYPEIKKRGGGKIINIGSMMSIFASEYASPYASSKGGIVQFTKACAIAWAKDNINVNSILPGWLHTDMTGAFLKMYPEREKLIEDRTPLARWGQPQDLAGTAVFLCSAASDFVTGASIAVDGGYSIK